MKYVNYVNFNLYDNIKMNCVTYNIMAQRYAVNVANSDMVPCWNDRLKMIFNKIPLVDIICLQEVELANINDIVSYYENLGYGYICHVVSKKRTNVIGNVILYLQTKLVLVESDWNSCGVFGTFIDVRNNNKF